MPVKKAKKSSRQEKPEKKAKKPKKDTVKLNSVVKKGPKKPKEKNEPRIDGKTPDIPPEPPHPTTRAEVYEQIAKEEKEKEKEDENEKIEAEFVDEMPEELRKIRDRIPAGRRPGQRGPGRPPKPAEGFDRLREIIDTEEYSNLEILVKPWTNGLDGLLQLLGSEFALTDNEKRAHTQCWASYLALAKPDEIDPEKMIFWTIFIMYVAILLKRGPRAGEKIKGMIEERKKRLAEGDRKRKEEIARKKNEQN